MVYLLATLILCNDAPGLKFRLDFFFFLLLSCIFERLSGLFLRRDNISLHHLGPSFPSPWLSPLILSGETPPAVSSCSVPVLLSSGNHPSVLKKFLFHLLLWKYS